MPSYVETILDPGERITYRAYLHWIVFALPIVLMLIGVAVLSFSQGDTAVVSIGLIISGFAALEFLKRAIDRWATEIVVTNQRVILKRGLIRRDTTEMNMPKVESVDVRQSILGRLLDYGTVIVRGTGGSPNPLAYVSAPLPLRRSVTLVAKSAWN
jgi:uncharacterized membrane protein YdbT with pleckstrin-like domain